MTASKTPTTPFDLEQNEKNSMEEMLKLVEDTSSFSKGELIQATIIDSDKENVYLDIGKKQEGRCPRSDFVETPAPGAEIQVIVQQSSPDGPVILSKKEADKRHAWESIREAFENTVQLSGQVSKTVNHGYMVEVGGVELFMPQSQSTARSGPRSRFNVGDKLDFKILELKESHRSAIISHRAVVEERNDTRWNELQEKYKVGDELEGVVSKIVSFGVFIEVAGIEGLLHQSDISWKKYFKFKGKFKRGQELKVKLIGMDQENNRLSLGLKQMGEDPWEWAQRELHPGDVVTGKVTSITDYGAFAEIQEGLEGLIHVSELTWAKRVKHPRNYLQTDQEIKAQVLAVDMDAKRISLGIRQLNEDPWTSVANDFQVGHDLEGPVTSVTKFGAFVQLKEDVEGLIHFNDYTWSDKIDRKMLKKGDSVRFKILDINQDERRISCGIKQLTESPFESLRKKYKNGDIIDCKVKNITTFGIFAEFDEGFEGLIHISNIPLRGNEKLEDHYKPGDPIKAILQKIDVNSQKIGLSIKAFERKQEREIISQYLKKDDSPSSSSPFGDFFKNQENETKSDS